MSAEIEEQLTVEQTEDNSTVTSSKKAIKTYTREFLLTFSELEVCKKLPEGFDESLLSDFQESSYQYGPLDRSRVLGSSPSQGFRRTDYGSSPPTRGDQGSYSRGLQRWDSRSSGKSEGDSDSESGKRFVGQPRRNWQNPEHDGLLGCGSFPRPPGYAAGSAVPRFRPSENSQLSKSNEPCQPPRPYKAGPYVRKETKDSFNDETFGSSDTTGEDRAEEEKNRRAEFERMRKEHHKAFQESQKLNSGKPKDTFAEMVGIVEVPNNSELSGGLDNVVKEDPPDDASKLSISSQAPPARRPLVPPGFVSSVVDKSTASKSNMITEPLQIENIEIEHGLHGRQDVKSVTQERVSSDWVGEKNISSNFTAKKDLSSVLHGVDQGRAPSLPGVTKVHENDETLGFEPEINGHKILGEPAHSTSILDKLFGNGLTITGESTSETVEGNDPKADDSWSPDKLQSKFACWFNEDDKKTLGNAPSKKTSSLLSLIIGGEMDGSDEVNAVATASIFSPEILPEQKTSKTAPSVLTCEDLEQSLLLEIGGEISSSQLPAKEQDTVELKREGIPGTVVDNSASQHLLSLLQGGMSSNNATSVLGQFEKHPDEEQKQSNSGLSESSTDTSGIREINHLDRTLTLESLFGAAFMMELHSAQRNSAPSKFGENGDGVGSHEMSILESNDGIIKSGKAGDWLDFQDAGNNMELSRLPFEADAKFGGVDGVTGVKFPEEDSLVNLIDPISTGNSIWITDSDSGSANLGPFSSNAPVNIMEKFVALGGARNDERSIFGGSDPLMLHNLYDTGKPEISYPNLHPLTSSPQLRRPPMNQSRTSFHPLDSHPAYMDPHLKFIPPEAVIHREASTHNHFPTNMSHPSFPHSSAGLPAFDHHSSSPVLQQMFMAGNHPPSHLVRGAPGAPPMPLHPNHVSAGFIQEHNLMQGFPYGQCQPSFRGPEMTPPGPELGVGNNSPEAFQRLVEMEQRINPKQMHPFAAGRPNQGMYEHELDMGYRYR